MHHRAPRSRTTAPHNPRHRRRRHRGSKGAAQDTSAEEERFRTRSIPHKSETRSSQAAEEAKGTETEG
eukprot:4938063-Pyramimonas_sp.AAC.1